MAEPTIDPVQSLLQDHAQACLADIRALRDERPQTAVQSSGDWTVVVAVVPNLKSEEAVVLSECDQLCLGILSASQVPLTASVVCRKLKQQPGVWPYALITVKRSLAKLRRAGLISNSRYRPRGYWLARNVPLFSE